MFWASIAALFSEWVSKDIWRCNRKNNWFRCLAVMFSYQLKISQLPIRVSIVEMRALGEIALIVSMPMQTFNSQFIQCSSFLLGYFNNHSKLINAKWHITKNGNAVITLWWNLASLSSVCWLLKPWYVFYLMNYYVHCVQSSKSDIYTICTHFPNER